MTAMLAAQPAFALKLGVLTDETGSYADLAGKGSIVATEMAIADYGGKALGKPIEMVHADHQNKADIGAAIANRWLDQDGVDAILDVPTSSVVLAVQEITTRKKKMHLNSTGATSLLTGEKCSSTTVHWTYDTFAVANSTARAIAAQGGDSWYFIMADYAFGQSLVRDATVALNAVGGKILGQVKHPFPNEDFASFLLQAQASPAKVIGLANAGSDLANTIKQAKEFGITETKSLAALLMFISDVHALGLEKAQGLMLTTGFYWDMDDQTRAWSKRFAERMNGRMPTMAQAGMYSAVMHYLKAVDAVGSEDAEKVVAKMRELPIKDFFARNAKLRPDGRMIHDMYLVQVKKPSESKGPWDYYKILRTIPGDEAFRPMKDGGCKLVTQ
jgi:branched-chain amino acid transport system substrate-binding protein